MKTKIEKIADVIEERAKAGVFPLKQIVTEELERAFGWKTEKPEVPCMFLARTNTGVMLYEVVNKDGKLTLLHGAEELIQEIETTLENIAADEYLIVEYYEY